MASFKKLETGKIRVSVYVNGHRDTKVLPANKAKSWAREREVELSRLSKVEDDTRTLGDLFRRYSEEVSPKKRGCEWEQKRLARFEHDEILSNIKLKSLTRNHLQHWVDQRLHEVMSSSVNRELNLLSNCLTKARLWQWIANNPFKDLERPKNPPPRNRRISEEEIQTLCHAADFHEGQALTKRSHFVAVAFLFAIETAMRASEICSLEKSSINFKTRVAHLTKTKNGDKRKVPLEKRAIELLKLLPEQPDKNNHIFHLTSPILDVNFRLCRKKTNIKDLHFHDSRHEATTRMAKLPNMNVLALARITGHRDLKFLMIYFNETAEELVERLDEKPEKPPIPETQKTRENSKVPGILAELADSEISEALLGKLVKQLVLSKEENHSSPQ